MRNPKLSLVSTIVLSFSPASIFFTAVYTESLFTFVTILAFYLFFSNYLHYENSLDNYANYFRVLAAPMLFLMISVCIRSNGLFYIVVPGYFILKTFFSCIFTSNFRKAIMIIIVGLTIFLLILLPYFIVLYYPYSLYCSDSYELIDNRPIWCFDSVPNAYDYNQKEHWNVRFLEQYKSSRITFIYWGSHSLIIIALLVLDFFKEKWLSFSTLGFLGEKRNEKYSEKWNPFMIYTMILFIISLFWAHTQSCTRFFSTCPCFSWFIASKLIGDESSSSLKKNESVKQENFEIKNKWILLYLIYFNVAGNYLFSNFLPWT